MGTSTDFLQCLETDMSLKILTCLDDQSDIFRAACVSRLWRDFIITHGLFKQLCLRMFPQFALVTQVTEPGCGVKKSVDIGPSNSKAWETLEMENRVYSYLARALREIEAIDCISGAIGASSTDNYPEESIFNTLDPRDRIFRRALYWSSTGQSDPAVPETLIYKLRADLCVVTEFKVQPFQAYFQFGLPIYSAKYVRLRMGHFKFPKDLEDDLSHLPLTKPADDKFIWTYTSPEFPMNQEYSLQSFKLPEPVVCVGGFVQIELLGRIQRQEIDNLFYICVSHVQVLGQPLSPSFGVEVTDSSGNFTLKYYPEAHRMGTVRVIDGEPCAISAVHASAPNLMLPRDLEEFFNALPPPIAPEFEPYEWEEDDIDVDEVPFL